MTKRRDYCIISILDWHENRFRMKGLYKIKMKRHLLPLLLAALCLMPAFTGCSGETDPEETPINAIAINLNGDTVSCEDPSVYITDDKVTITAHGTYVISGTWNDGQIYVECVDAGETNLILDNANITNDDQACIFIRKSQLATITLKDGTVNTLTDGTSYTYDNPSDDEPDSVIFSKEDLIMTGGGKLIVDANYLNGIVSKDGLKIEDGEYVISAANDGMKGKDYLMINGGTLDIDAAGDGIKSTNIDSELVGYVEINGGTVNIKSDDEAIQAVTKVTVNGGTVNIDSTNNGIRSDYTIAFNGGTVTVNAEDNSIEASDVKVADEASVTINGIPYKG